MIVHANAILKKSETSPLRAAQRPDGAERSHPHEKIFTKALPKITHQQRKRWIVAAADSVRRRHFCHLPQEPFLHIRRDEKER